MNPSVNDCGSLSSPRFLPQSSYRLAATPFSRGLQEHSLAMIPAGNDHAHDAHNLILYAFVTPIYMAASVAIVYCVLSSFSFTDRTAIQSDFGVACGLPRDLVWFWAAIVLLSGLVQVNYFRDNIIRAEHKRTEFFETRLPRSCLLVRRRGCQWCRFAERSPELCGCVLSLHAILPYGRHRGCCVVHGNRHVQLVSSRIELDARVPRPQRRSRTRPRQTQAVLLA